MRQHYSGEVGDFLILCCGISSWLCTPKIIKISSFLPIY